MDYNDRVIEYRAYNGAARHFAKLTDSTEWVLILDEARRIDFTPDFDYTDTGELTWDGHKLYSKKATGKYYASLYIPRERKDFLRPFLLEVSPDGWEKRFMLSYSKPPGSDIPLALEQWQATFGNCTVKIKFYWLPVEGEHVGPTCTIQSYVSESFVESTKRYSIACATEGADEQTTE